MLPLGVRLSRGAIWNLIGTIFNQGSVFVGNIAVARIIEKHEFGEYSIVLSTLVTFAVLAQLSMGYTAAKYVAEFHATDREKVGRILGLCFIFSALTACLVTILMILAAFPLASQVMKAPHLSTALIIGSGYVFFAALNGYQVGAFIGLEGYQGLSKAAIASGFVTVAGISLGAWWIGLNGALLGLSVTAMFRCILHRMWLTKEFEVSGLSATYKNLRQEMGVIHRFALPAALSGYVAMPAIWLGNTFLVRQHDGFDQMALYQAAFTVRMAVMFVPQVINNVGMPVLNSLKGRGDAVNYRRAFWITVAANAVIVLLVSLVLMGIGPMVLGWFGKGYPAAFSVLKILLLAALIEGVAITVYQIIQSHGMLWQSLLFVALPYCSFFVILAYRLTPPLGAAGLAIAYSGGWAVNLAATCLIAHKIMSEPQLTQGEGA